MLPDFTDVTQTLFELQEKYPNMTWTPHDGYITIDLYLGIQNTDLLKQAQIMFAPAE